MFSLEYLLERPRPFYTLAEALFPDPRAPYKPSYAHQFLRLLQDKGKLQRVVTQNIDDIEKQVGVKNLFQAHGTFSERPICVHCSYQARNAAVILAASKDGAVAHCPQCGSVLKPQIVFFGENLSSDVANFPTWAKNSDCMLIMGTSLKVAPVSALPALAVANKKNRVLVNGELVGDFCMQSQERQGKDAALIGDLDKQVQLLAKKLGWDQELEKLYQQQANGLESTVLLKNALKSEEKPLRLVGLKNSLIVPTAQVKKVKGQKIQFALVTELQYNVLLSQCEKSVLKIEKEDIQPQFAFFYRSELPVFQKTVLRGDQIVYAPLGGHYSHYISKFIQLSIFHDETDVWDLLTRRAGTKVGDQFQMPQPDLTSGCAVLRDIEKYLQEISNGLETVEAMDLTDLKWDVKETKMPLDFTGDDDTEIPEIVFELKIEDDVESTQKVEARFLEKQNILLDGIKDALRVKTVSLKLIKNKLYIKFTKEQPETAREVIKPIVKAFFEKAGAYIVQTNKK